MVVIVLLSMMIMVPVGIDTNKQQADKDVKHRKQQLKPVREDSFPSELIFAKTDFAFVDKTR